jgi:PIN domain nuclease of toxin-antitoxin system
VTRPERVLLDTHVWLWLALGTARRIPQAALRILEDTGKVSGLMVSIVSIWELALLVARERIVLPLPLNEWVPLALSRPEIRLLGLSRPETFIDAVNLPGEIHADPADRFLIATARSRRVTLATHDERILAYGESGHVRVLAI